MSGPVLNEVMLRVIEDIATLEAIDRAFKHCVTQPMMSLTPAGKQRFRGSTGLEHGRDCTS